MENEPNLEQIERESSQSQAVNVALEREQEAEEWGLDSSLEAEDENIGFVDAYKLDMSVSVAETNTPEANDAFDEALLEMEGKKSFECSVCSKVCKSKGGLTRHQNSKHSETSAKGRQENIPRLALDQRTLDDLVETIKARIIKENLYGEEINSKLEKVTSTPKLYQALLPIYETFCRKKNQDILLKEFYGLMRKSCELLKCDDFRVANLIMIQLPDFLVGHYNTAIQRHKHGETGIAQDNPSELNMVERGPLAYIAGYVVSKLTQINGKKKECVNEQIQALLQSMKSQGPANSFIDNRTRGGLTSPCDDLVNILEVTELLFRDEINRTEGILRNIPTDTICNAVVDNPKVKSLWDNIVMSCSTQPSATTQKLCLENVIKLFLKVRSFSYANDYITKYRIQEKQGKNKALRIELKRKNVKK